jgi:hypothetical protein
MKKIKQWLKKDKVLVATESMVNIVTMQIIFQEQINPIKNL